LNLSSVINLAVYNIYHLQIPLLSIYFGFMLFSNYSSDYGCPAWVALGSSLQHSISSPASHRSRRAPIFESVIPPYVCLINDLERGTESGNSAAIHHSHTISHYSSTSLSRCPIKSLQPFHTSANARMPLPYTPRAFTGNFTPGYASSIFPVHSQSRICVIKFA
jgi:hypothetical protein